MRKVISVAAALALIAPSMASAAPAPAAPATAAKVLSVKASALHPRRAPAKGERLSAGSTVLVGVLVVAAVGGVIAATSGSDSR